MNWLPYNWLSWLHYISKSENCLHYKRCRLFDMLLFEEHVILFFFPIHYSMLYVTTMGVCEREIFSGQGPTNFLAHFREVVLSSIASGKHYWYS